MEKKFSWLLAILIPIMSFAITSCDDDDNIGGETHYYSGNSKVSLKVMNNKAELFFYPENEEALRRELSKHNLSLNDVRENIAPNPLDKYGEESRRIYENLMRGTVKGNCNRFKSALKYTVAWSPYYRFVDDGLEAIPLMSFNAKPKPEVEYQQLVQLAKKYNVTITYKKDDPHYSIYYYEFVCTNKSKGNNVEMAVIFYKSGLFEWSEPDFIIPDFNPYAFNAR